MMRFGRPPPEDFSLSPSRLTILVVEDNIINQRIVCKQLSNAGHAVIVANHGGEALEEIKKCRFWAANEHTGQDLSIILMDLEMPVMDGLSCARKIRELEHSKSILTSFPIVAVTANARDDQIKAAVSAGMVGFLPIVVFFGGFFAYVDFLCRILSLSSRIVRRTCLSGS